MVPALSFISVGWTIEASPPNGSNGKQGEGRLSSAFKGMSLADLDKTLEGYCSHVTLLSEIPISRVDVDQIGLHLRALVHRSQTSELRKLFARHQCTWIVYMAAVAARNDDLGYWNALGEFLGVTGHELQQAHLGRAFLDAIHSLGLPDFADAGGYTYVTPIRLHGGIPAYSLPDFFGFLVLPAAQDDKYSDQTPAEQIKSLLAQPNVNIWVDSPALHYLTYGGLVAERFFQACIAMAQMWLQDGELSSPPALGLPYYVVNAFRAFMESRLQTKGKKRLRAPRLLIDPFSNIELFRLELPPQPVDADRAAWRYAWKIRMVEEGMHFNQPCEERVRVRQIGYDQTTEPRSVRLEFPPSQVRIEFWAAASAEDHAATELLGRWVVQLAPHPGQVPLLAFRPPHGQVVQNDEGLPAEVLWLLYPRMAQLSLTGAGRCIRHFADMLGDWDDWKIEEWNLTKAESVVVKNESMVWPLTVRSELQEPRFEGGLVLESTSPLDDIPFFVGEPPKIWFPHASGKALAEELNSWRVTVCSRWAAEPSLPEAEPRPLSNWATSIVHSNGGVELPLAAIVGPRPMGLYMVAIEGPQHQRLEKRLRIWPGIVLHDWQPYYLPGEQGAETVTFSIGVPHGHRVIVQPGAEGLTVEQDPSTGLYSVSVMPDSVEAPLFVEAPQPRGEPIRLALHICVPRLRWRLTTDEATTRWSTAPIRLPVDQIQQSASSYLTLELNTLQWPAYCLALSDGSTNSNSLQESEWRSPQSGQRRQHLSLAEYNETLRHQVDCPVFAFTLLIHIGTAVVNLPLLYLSRSLEVTAVLMEWTASGIMRLHWEARHRLRNRRVQIWPVWQPWLEPCEFIIPDAAAPSVLADEPGSGVMDLPKPLPRGWYWVSFRTAPSWERQCAPSIRPADALITRDADPEWRLMELEDLAAAATKSSAFVSHLERACIFDGLGNCEMRTVEIQWLFEHLSDAHPAHLFVYYRWLETCDPATQRAVRMRMYAPSLLGPVLTDSQMAGIRKLYLASFTATNYIRPESANLILENRQDPDLVSHAVSLLMKERQPEAVRYLLRRVTEGAFSEQDALAFLRIDVDFGLESLLQQPNSSVQERLVTALLPYAATAQLVMVGDWIRTEAGWGSIQNILLGECQRAYFDPRREQPRLNVMLRPGENQAPIVVDLACRTITFSTKARSLYQCAKEGCLGFISSVRDDVTFAHNHAAHNGVGPIFSQLADNSWKYRAAPKFAHEQPTNLYS